MRGVAGGRSPEGVCTDGKICGIVFEYEGLEGI